MNTAGLVYSWLTSHNTSYHQSGKKQRNKETKPDPSSKQISPDDPAFYLVEINRFLLEDESKKIASDLSSTAMKFDVIATQNMDNFIHVANEALSKFMQRTNELKAVAKGLTLPQFIEVKKVSSEQNSNTLSTKDKTDGITLVMVFACGVLLGAILIGLKLLIK